MERDDRTSRRRPPWWPENEPWPPADYRGPWGGGPWRGGPWGRGPWRRGRAGRGYFVGRFGCLLAGLTLIGSVGVLLLWLVVSAVGLVAPGFAGGPLGQLAPIAGIVVLVVGAIALATVGRWLRWTGGILDELVDATGRVESGNYAVRVPDRGRGPRPLRALVRGFNTMVERLDADERQRRTLLADVSHELRTPIAIIQGNLEAIADGVHEADPEHLAALLEETRVMARLVDDLRTVALSEAGTLPLHREPTDPDVLASEVIASFRAAADEAGVDVALEAPDDVPLLDVDPVRIREVLANLVANALRYTPPGGQVRVRMTPDGDARRVVIEVTDTGTGIDPDVLPHVFERFVKAPGSRGSGLGLAIARNLVVAHGGGIEADSRPDGGTTIRFWLPLPAE
jgi:signal transduction histidine kinase